MSGITRIKGKVGYFSATYRLACGKKRKITTKTTSEDLARRISTLWLDIESGVYKKKEVAQNAVDSLEVVISSKLPEVGKAREKVLHNYSEKSKELIYTHFNIKTQSIREMTKIWLDTKRRKGSTTYTKYESDIRHFLEFLENDADAEINDFQRSWLGLYATHLMNEYGLATSTINGKLKNVRQFLKYSYTEGYADHNYGDKWQCLKPSVSEKRDRVKRRKYTEDEITTVLDYAGGDWYDVITFALYTGQRLGDIVTAAVSDFDMTHNAWRFFNIKKGRRMEVPLTPQVLEIVKRRSSHGEFLFPQFAAKYNRVIEKGGIMVKQGSLQLSNQFNDHILVPTGLSKIKHSCRSRKAHGKRGAKQQSELCFHSLRYTAASMMHERGMSERVVKDIIGHDCDAVHNVYVDISLETKAKEMEKMQLI